MDSESQLDLRELLEGVNRNYRNIFRGYRNEFGYLDSDLWFKDFQVDYVLEVILANFSMTNLLCEQILEEIMKTPRYIDELDDEIMPDYDLGYILSQDCDAVIAFANSFSSDKDELARPSLIEELFYAHIQYFNHSLTGNRRGWLDVNKRLVSSMMGLLEFDSNLMDLVDLWSEDIDLLFEDDTESDVPLELLWKKEFIERLKEKSE